MDAGLPLLRIGSDGDGGYLVPDDLEDIAACFSPGVSDNAAFERGLFEAFGIPSFLADASVDAPPAGAKEMDFEKKFLSNANSTTTIRLADWIKGKMRETPGDLILQIDIEGAEYEVLWDTPLEVLKRFRIIVIELHWLEALLLKSALPHLEAFIRKLTANHTVVHLHPNNVQDPILYHGISVPPLLEVTLLRNDRISGTAPVRSFPHALDRPNVPHKPDLALPVDWYDVT